MSREEVRNDIEKLRTAKANAPVPLEELMRSFEWFKPLPRARGGATMTAPARKMAITRLLKALYVKVQTAVLEDELTVAPERPTTFDMADIIKHHKGALPATRRRKGQEKDPRQVPRLQGGPYINYNIVIDTKFTTFVGGDEEGGGLSASYGGSKATAGKQPKRQSNWAQLMAGVETLRSVDTIEVKAFVALFDRLEKSRKKPGPRTKKGNGNPS